jgi:eukaryotic-like serine/threonine-protein kinase
MGDVAGMREDADRALRSTVPDPDGTQPAGARVLDIGARIGRFVMLEVIGAGGMGVVVAAYDPQLDRRVAIKLLRTDVLSRAAGDAGDGKARLQREAQAMARLTHPNVVAVYEVGDLGDGLFIVMEHVKGTTLAAWLHAEKRAPAAIVAAFTAAGRGLVAAHRAGVVHRDFKPENVLVADDGRVLVTDFGLAGGFEPTPVDGATTVDTLVGAGTPRYMAPEQHDGSPSDARSDQYAFCVALFEALAGRYPFPAERGPEALAAKRSGVLVARGTTRRDTALRRGLAADPAARWPSMGELLAAIEPPRRPAPVLLAFGAAMLALVGVAVWQSGRRDATCDGGATRVAEVWTPARRASVQMAFRASGLGFADESLAIIDARLAGATARWSALHREVCVATRIRGEQSDALMDHRMACLERARTAMIDLVDTLGRAADEAAVTRAVPATNETLRFEHCPTAALDDVVGPPRPEVRSRVDALQREADAVRTLGRLARFAEARPRAYMVLVEARLVGYAPLVAEALAVAATIEGQAANVPAARDLVLETIESASAVGRDDLVAAAMADLLQHIGGNAGEARDAAVVSRLAEAARRRAGGTPVDWARLRTLQGLALDSAGDAEGAVARHRAALELLAAADEPAARAQALNALANAEESLAAYADARVHYEEARALFAASQGPTHPSVAGTLNNLGLIAQHQGDYDAADAYYARAIELKTRAFGPDHPSVARTLNARAMLWQMQGRLVEAKELFERVIEIREAALGPRDQSVASSLGSLSSVEVNLGHLDRARELSTRSLAILVELFGEDHGRVGFAQVELGDVELAAGDLRAARASYERAVAVLAAAKGTEHPDYAMAVAGVVEVDLAERRYAEARRGCAVVTAVAAATQGADSTYVAAANTNCARALVGLGRPAEAIALLTEAVAILEKRDIRLSPAVAARFDLAKLLWPRGERDRARALATRALEIGEALPGEDLGELRAWLATHGD